MLDVKQNSIDYGSLLMPPPGFILKRAVATTYSLDLNALLAIPVALYYSKPLETDFERNPNPYDVLNSISQANKTVTVFCQRGKIHVPKKHNRLLGFTQDCIVEVTPGVAYSSFHPKCWWLLFEDVKKKQQVVRFAVMSRNLTFDRSWDVAFCMEGYVDKVPKESNNSMLDMLGYLEQQSGYLLPKYFKHSVACAQFEVEAPFDKWRFFPIGISDAYPNPLESPSFRYDDILLMSPFVDDATVTGLANKALGSAWLFARRSELDTLKSSTIDTVNGAYCIPDTIVNGELDEDRAEDVPNTDPQVLDLHAKLYISRKGETNTWLLGSANCTRPAFERNIECLLELKSTGYYTSPKQVIKELVTTEKEWKLFDVYESAAGDGKTVDSAEQVLRKLECDLMGCSLIGNFIHHEETGLYSYSTLYDLTSVKIPGDFKVYLKPFYSDPSNDLGERLKGETENAVEFDVKVKESLLSKFFVVSITYKDELHRHFLVKAKIDMPETWSAKILAEILESQEKFLQYFRFLISDNGLVEGLGLEPEQLGGPGSGHSITSSIYCIPIFEELMRTASRSPHRLKAIDDVFKRLLHNEETKKVIPAELIEVWGHFSHLIEGNEQ